MGHCHWPPTPLVAEKADFGPDLLLVDFCIVAAPGREFADAAQVDRPGVKIGVGRNSGPDQFLSRTLKSAELVRPGGGGASRRYVAAKRMCGRRTLPMSKGSPMRSPGQRLYRGHSQPSGTRWHSERTIICGSGQFRRDRQRSKENRPGAKGYRTARDEGRSGRAELILPVVAKRAAALDFIVRGKKGGQL